MGLDMNGDPMGAWSPGAEPSWKCSLLHSGPGRSGSPIGHIAPAFGFIVMAVIMLWTSLQRARALHPGQSFCESHIPERDGRFLTRFCRFISLVGVIGFGYEVTAEWTFFAKYNYHPRAHQAMFASYATIGLFGVWEAQKRLPADAHRMGFIACQLIQGIIWWEHAEHKFLKSDQKLHYFLAWTCFAGAVTFAYSVAHPQSTVAFLVGWMLFLLQGTMMVQTGFYEGCVDIPTHMVGTVFSLHIIGLTFVVGVVTAFFVPSHLVAGENQSSSARGTFSELKQTTDEDREYGTEFLTEEEEP